MLFVPAVCIAFAASASNAAVTAERYYSMGDYFDGSSFEGQTSSNGPDGSVVQASFSGIDVVDGLNDGSFADLTQAGAPVYHAITAADVTAGHPGNDLNPDSPGTDYGIRFDGADDILSTAMVLNQLDAGTPRSQGVQFWAKPSAAGLTEGARQSLVTDTNNFGGPAITTTGMWTMTSADHTNIAGVVAVAADQWAHVAMHAYLPGDEANPGGGADWTSVLYVNGVASAVNADTNITGGDLVSEFTIGADNIGGSTDNFYNGVIDELTAYFSEPDGFDLLTDNAFIAQAIDDSYVAAGKASGTPYEPGDLNLDGDVDDDDVDAFVAGWLKKKQLVGAHDTLLVGDFQTLQWGDLNLDGQVNLIDAFQLHEALAPVGGLDFSLLAGGTPTPEPASAMLLAAAGLLGIRRRR